MKRTHRGIAVAMLLAGCSAPITVQVIRTDTNRPATDVMVERRRHVNRFEKITNPIGATYHPHRVAERLWLDTDGRCVFEKLGKDDIVDVFTTSPEPLAVTLAGHSIRLTPQDNRAFSTWIYSIWLDSDGLRYTVTEGTLEWTKTKPE